MLTRRKFKLVSLDGRHIVKSLGGSIISVVIHCTVRIYHFRGSVVALLRHHGPRIVHVALLNLPKLLLLMRYYVHQAVKLLLHLFKGVHRVIFCHLRLLGWLILFVILRLL